MSNNTKTRTKPRTVNAEGITSCCGAYTSIFIDDGMEYCKECFETVGHEL